MNYLTNLGTAASQFFNSFLLNGRPDQTISARAHTQQHKQRWKIARKVINSIFFLQADHCLKSHNKDIANAKRLLEICSEEFQNRE